MGKQGVLSLVLGISIGASLVLAAWVVYLVNTPRQAYGGTVDTNGLFSVASARLVGRGEAEAFWVFNHEKEKLAVYLMNNRNLEILAVRDCSYDFRPAQYSPKGGRQDPSVKFMRTGKN